MIIRNLMFLAATIVVICTSAQADNILLQKNGRTIQVVSNETLGPKNRKQFRSWRNGPNYFGAIVYNKNVDGAYGSSRGLHTLNQARKDAMAICRARTEIPNDCFEYAYVIPRGYDPAKSGTTIGQAALEDFQGPYSKRLRKGSFGAFAIDDGFSFGWAVNRPSAESAREQAVLECERGAATARANAKESIRKALQLDKRLQCKVVHVSQR